MKVFQVLDGFLHWDASRVLGSAAEAKEKFPPTDTFVNAPDYVFESWGFDPSKEGDARFIKPTPPEGWKYDDDTGTFYPEDELPPGKQPTVESVTEEILVDHEYRLTMLEFGL